MDGFKFSIIISAYNSEIDISRCINSIINQTLNFKNNVEIILINDGSRDKTNEICKDYASEYPENIQYISKKHEGKGASRNLGLQFANGKYIEFLDGDDYLSRNALRNVLDFFENNRKVDVVSIPTIFLKSENNFPYFDLKYENLKEYHALYNHIEEHYDPKKENFVFVDEIQLCGQFELIQKQQ